MVIIITGVVTVLTIDWARLMPMLIGLGIIVGGWYWLSRQMPAFIRRLGMTATRQLWNVMRGNTQHSRRR